METNRRPVHPILDHPALESGTIPAFVILVLIVLPILAAILHHVATR